MCPAAHTILTTNTQTYYSQIHKYTIRKYKNTKNTQNAEMVRIRVVSFGLQLIKGVPRHMLFATHKYTIYTNLRHTNIQYTNTKNAEVFGM